eukprot:s2526_g17.t1
MHSEAGTMAFLKPFWIKPIWLKAECRVRKLMAGQPHLIFVESPLDASLIAIPVMDVAQESSSSETEGREGREGTGMPSPIKGMVVQTQHDGQGNARADQRSSSFTYLQGVSTRFDARLARFKPQKTETSGQLSALSASTNQQASTTDTLEGQDASDSKDASSDLDFACIPGRDGSSSESAQGDLVRIGEFNTLEAHESGVCKPCRFYQLRDKGCRHGDACKFCHFCDRDAARQERLRIKYNDRRLKRRRDRIQQQRIADVR